MGAAPTISAGWVLWHPRMSCKNIILFDQYFPPQHDTIMFTQFLYLMFIKGMHLALDHVMVEERHDLDKKHLPYTVCLQGARLHHCRPGLKCKSFSDFLTFLLVLSK